MLSYLAVAVLACSAAGVVEVPRISVTSELVCRVKDALSPRRPRRGHGAVRRHSWSARRCERVAAALREAPDPVELLAVCIHESDLRERAVAWTSPSKVDVGLCQVRCVLGEGGRCANGVVEGMRLEDLYDPVLNVQIAAQILAAKGSTSRYAGETVDRGYSRRVSEIAAALSGVAASPRGRRMRDHVRRIVAAVAEVPRS